MPFIECGCEGCKFNIPFGIKHICKHRKPILTSQSNSITYDCETFETHVTKPKKKGVKK